MNNAYNIPNTNTSELVKIKKQEPTGIAFRMLILMIIFIALIFSAIFLSFNIFMTDYVKNDINNQLTKAVNDITNQHFISVTKNQIKNNDGQISGEYTVVTMLPVEFIYNEITKSIRDTNSKTDVNAVIYYKQEDDYTRIFPNNDYDILNLKEMDGVVNMIKINNFSEKDIYKTSLNSGNYYITAVDLSELYGWTGYSIAFYVSSAKYDKFMDSIYSMLLIILISATIFTILYVIFISRSISKPIQELCGFADEIGRGNFKQNEYWFKDRELIDLNERMNETARKLEKNDEDQKTFFQNVSHELKTPLMSIKGYAEGIKYGIFSTEEEKNGASDIIIAESDRLNGLVADLLYISKIDASKNTDKRINVNASLGELVESCAEKLRGLLINSKSKSEKKINVYHPKNDIYLNCDEESMIRALMNIASNCLRYAKSSVDISFYDTETGVFLSIKDDGDGIDEKDLPNIFKRFYKGKGGKHGIGLSIAKSIIEQHNAKITAQNRADDAGAEFIIEFDKNATLL